MTSRDGAVTELCYDDNGYLHKQIKYENIENIGIHTQLPIFENRNLSCLINKPLKIRILLISWLVDSSVYA